MKVIEYATMPNGTEIVLEDWTENNSSEYPNLYGYAIGAFPIAKNTGRYVKGGEKFRLDISMNPYVGYTNEMVLEDFKALKSGTKCLENLSERYYDGDKAKYYMGILNIEPEY